MAGEQPPRHFCLTEFKIHSTILVIQSTRRAYSECTNPLPVKHPSPKVYMNHKQEVMGLFFLGMSRTRGNFHFSMNQKMSMLFYFRLLLQSDRKVFESI